ncbi:MAG: DUF1592 domain-containing protein [Planctomycetales bacterium]|nr:DUF1592 domain-containing protein [Planctomycetales bacterium]
MLDLRSMLRLMLLVSIGISFHCTEASAETNSVLASSPELKQFWQDHCLDCHSEGDAQAGLDLRSLLELAPAENTAHWESVVRKLASRQMPPSGEVRPSENEYRQALAIVTSQLDDIAVKHPNPGRTETFRRLNRTEYRNAIRDLLALDIDTSEMLPSDESSHGFDNVTVTGLSPVLLDRYVSAAQKISQLAVGHRTEPAAEKTYRIRPDITQDAHLPGTPIGTRGGLVVEHMFPQPGEYEIQAWLMRDRNEELEGLRGKHELEFLLDRERVQLFQIEPPGRGENDSMLDANLTARVHVSAGPHDVGVVFPKRPSALLQTVRQPLNVHFNYYRHPRIGPAVYQLTIRGPFNGQPAQDTPSRQRIFVCSPAENQAGIPGDAEECAEVILNHLMTRAYRRQVTAADLASPMEFFRSGLAVGGFDAGIEKALSAILVNPNFLFRIERHPEGVTSDEAYQISPVELASRLSFFLWSSIPDEDLLATAINGSLAEPSVLESQVRRMLADKRAGSLIDNFADQWLYLRNLDSAIPDMRLFPDFDDNLRQSLRRETELFIESIVREDRSILDLLRADYTFLNERLAKHYGIPNIYGSHFRRVALTPSSHRGGLLRQGSILMVTSYATRTSPVLRGHWVLKNLLGSPPPPPPPNVPALEDNTVSADLSLRDRLEQHRAHEACASCHNLLDPIGFALENYDAVGRYRELENGSPIDATGTLLDGSEINGVLSLEQMLLNQPELFAQTLAERLMTFSLGRGMDHNDAPAIRRVVQQAQQQDYRFSEIILGIVKSVPFQMRKSQ